MELQPNQKYDKNRKNKFLCASSYIKYINKLTRYICEVIRKNNMMHTINKVRL